MDLVMSKEFFIRNTVVAALTLFMMFSVTALDFNVDVAEIVDSSEYDLSYLNETDTVQTVSMSIENRGSIGCEYRLRGEFEYDNETFTRYSSPHQLWQGSYTDAEISFIPMNYTGEVEASVYNEFCDEEKHVEDFTFNVTENTTSNSSVESETVSVTETDSNVSIGDVESGLMVPEEEPSFWKTSSASINNSQATLHYDAPIFRHGENITYTVLNSESEVVGSTEVWLNTEETFMDKVRDNFEYLIILVLVLGILGLLLERRKLTEK